MKDLKPANKPREHFSSGLAIFFATLGSAVGLGNIWKFPYLTGANGGAAFLLIYLFCVLLIGIPIMTGEFYIGRKARANAVGAFDALKAKPYWKIIGFGGILSAYLIMFFYADVAGWVYAYLFRTLTGGFAGITAETAGAQFDALAANPLVSLLWQAIVLIVVSIILVGGVKKGIERVTKVLMPLLFVLVIIVCVRSLMLPGAASGLRFLFVPDFSKVTPRVVLSALGLAFFKLSLGMGCMITYASYFRKDNNLLFTATRVAVADTIVSLLAGIAIFPAVFSFGIEPGAGPSLLFQTIPMVFAKIPFGQVLLALFFLLTAFAATTAMISLVEVPNAYFVEHFKMTRKKAVFFNALIMFAVGSLATLSSHKDALLSGVKPFGMTFFDLFDFLSSNILLPVGGLLIALFVGWVVKRDSLMRELSNDGTLRIRGLITVFRFVIMFVTPVLLIIVFLNSLGIIKIS